MSALLPASLSAAAQADPSAADWSALRLCESSGRYDVVATHGHYGAYQFDLATWRSVGGTGLPSDASPAEQDFRALTLYRMRGWQPWECAGILGLSADGDAAGRRVPTRAESAYMAAAAPASTPAWPGRVYVFGDCAPELRIWQLRMNSYGYTFEGTGCYGDKTRQAVLDVQRANGLTPSGILGPKTWAAAWNGTPPLGAPAWPGTVYVFGDCAPDLRVWQLQMNRYGYGFQGTSCYGDKTRQAVLDLQRANGLVPNGELDRATWLAAWTGSSPTGSPPVTAPPGTDPVPPVQPPLQPAPAPAPAPPVVTPAPPAGGMPAITTSGNRILRDGKPWWFVGYNSFVWSANCGRANEVMSADEVDRWFASMRHDGHGAVRLFFYKGWNVGRLDAALASARKHNIYVTLTLDDAIGGCGENDKTPGWFANAGERADFKAHMSMLLDRYKGDPTIAWFEYFNEPGKDGTAPQLRAFYDEMGAHAATIDPTRLFSSGTVAPYWVGGESAFANISASPGVDIVSLHEYDQGEVESNHGPRVRRNAAGKPVIVGEMGIHASPSGSGCNTDYAERARRIDQKLGAYTRTDGYAGALAWAWGKRTGCQFENLDADVPTQTVLRTFTP